MISNQKPKRNTGNNTSKFKSLNQFKVWKVEYQTEQFEQFKAQMVQLENSKLGHKSYNYALEQNEFLMTENLELKVTLLEIICQTRIRT